MDDKLLSELDDLDKENKLIQVEIERKKNKLASDIDSMGEYFISEIEKKNEKKEAEKKNYIKYITKSTKHKYGNEDYLNDLSFEEIESIYNEVRESKKPWYIILFETIT